MLSSVLFCILLSLESLLFLLWFSIRHDDVYTGKKLITQARVRLDKMKDEPDDKIAVAGRKAVRPSNMDITFPEWDTQKEIPAKTYGQLKAKEDDNISEGYYRIHKGVRGMALSLIYAAFLLYWWIPVGMGLSNGEDWALYRHFGRAVMDFLPGLISRIH